MEIPSIKFAAAAEGKVGAVERDSWIEMNFPPSRLELNSESDPPKNMHLIWIHEWSGFPHQMVNSKTTEIQLFTEPESDDFTD